MGLARKRQHLIQKETGHAWGPDAEFYSFSYLRRVEEQVRIEIEMREQATDIVILNCIDWLYGHSLLKLLNAQTHLDAADGNGLVVLVPERLRWLVPDGVAEVWSITLTQRDGLRWNDWIGQELKRQASRFDRVWLSGAVSHPHPSNVQLSRFSRVAPFDISKWDELPPTVTFIWREDRTWPPPKGVSRFVNALLYRLRVSWSERYSISRQRRAVTRLYRMLREVVEGVNVSVVGFGDSAPEIAGCYVSVSSSPSPRLEKEWCERYAQSQVVVGVHGSNMLLPSGHSGSVVELVPNDRWPNFMQDILPTRTDAREAVYCNRFLPLGTPFQEIATCIETLIRNHEYMRSEFHSSPLRSSS